MPEIGFNPGTSYLGLGAAEDAQQRVFGEYTKKDMTDYSQLAFTALMKEQEQAYQTAMYNYNNWYNSDSQRMQRRIAAGLNPYGLEGSPAAAAVSAPSAPVARSSGTAAKGFQAVSSSMQNVISLLSQAREVYDLLEVKAPLASQQRSNLSMQQLYQGLLYDKQSLENDWLSYLLGSDAPEHRVLADSPRGLMYLHQMEAQEAKVEQLKFLVNQLYPSQKERNEALKALDDYRQEVMKGQNDAILNIHTGNDTLDGILKSLVFWLGSKISF